MLRPLSAIAEHGGTALLAGSRVREDPQPYWNTVATISSRGSRAWD